MPLNVLTETRRVVKEPTASVLASLELMSADPELSSISLALGRQLQAVASARLLRRSASSRPLPKQALTKKAQPTLPRKERSSPIPLPRSRSGRRRCRRIVESLQRLVVHPFSQVHLPRNCHRRQVSFTHSPFISNEDADSFLSSPLRSGSGNK